MCAGEWTTTHFIVVGWENWTLGRQFQISNEKIDENLIPIPTSLHSPHAILPPPTLLHQASLASSVREENYLKMKGKGNKGKIAVQFKLPITYDA